MMHHHRNCVTAGLISLAVGTTPVAALAATTVHVGLQDPSTEKSVAKMQIVLQPDQVRAGRVAFEVQNQSKTTIHEMLLLKQPPNNEPLPYDAKSQQVIESKTAKLVDTGDIKPGSSATKAITLRPGAYEIVCNQPGHYAQGMRAAFTVTR
jgi:uncharacterized cupredoxin-like copper-binding protein